MSKTVLITGASGFVAAHVLNSFLERGYNVKATVRSDATAENVKKTHAKYATQLSFAIVQDVAAPGAFDEAVKGVDGVIHTASPFVVTVEDNEKDLLIPAIHGTTEVLKAIQAYNPNVKRVVITSSFAALVDMSKGNRPGYTYSEKDWNEIDYETAKNSPYGGVAYTASKVLAEKAAWEYVEKNKPNFTISTILPPIIYGPPAHSFESFDKLNTSSADIYRLINGSEKTVPPTTFFAFVDVRDVGEAHFKAYESGKAAGERYFITSGNFSYQEICDNIRADFPELHALTPEGTPGAPLPPCYGVDNTKAKTELGMTFRSLKETIHDQVKEFLELEKKLNA